MLKLLLSIYLVLGSLSAYGFNFTSAEGSLYSMAKNGEVRTTPAVLSMDEDAGELTLSFKDHELKTKHISHRTSRTGEKKVKVTFYHQGHDGEAFDHHKRAFQLEGSYVRGSNLAIFTGKLFRYAKKTRPSKYPKQFAGNFFFSAEVGE